MYTSLVCNGGGGPPCSALEWAGREIELKPCGELGGEVGTPIHKDVEQVQLMERGHRRIKRVLPPSVCSATRKIQYIPPLREGRNTHNLHQAELQGRGTPIFYFKNRYRQKYVQKQFTDMTLFLLDIIHKIR